jgi:NADH:ubiquinone oxidoreductase subunit
VLLALGAADSSTDFAAVRAALLLDIAASQWHQRRAMSLKTFFVRFFTWWNGQTFGTQVWTALHGEFVGEDERGNRYYRAKGGKIDPTFGFERRWVIYNGYAEPTTIGPDWHGWMHHTIDIPPTSEKVRVRPWWKPHLPNMTGTPFAYRPPGSTLAEARRPQATGDYQAWSPE